MDLSLLVIVFVASISCFLIFGQYLKPIRNGVSRKGLGESTVPEATGSWPIIGHLHLLAGSQQPHRLLGSMADKFGSIFTIKFGSHRVLVVSSSDMAKECLTTNDRVLASRPKAMASELMCYNYAMFSFGPDGPFWRHMRKIIVLELASQNRLQMLEHIRVSEVKSSIRDIFSTWVRNKGPSETIMVDMKQWFGDIIVNMVGRMMIGDSFSPGQPKRDEFLTAMNWFVEMVGAFVPSDAIPALKWLDLGGYEKKMKKTALEMDAVLNGWLQDYRNKIVDGSGDQPDFMASVLSRVQEEVKQEVYGFSIDDTVKATCLAIFAAASDTTTVTLIWALALLVNNPVVLKKAQEELDKHVGRDRQVEESDMNNLVYLQAILKETMRLYPAAPLSIPHESTEDCIVGGYTVPKGTRVWVNMWKIHHDPEIWTHPFEFQPERFLTSKKEIDVKGRHFELIPFGSGRRICPGSSFALQAVQLTLASVIHGFEFRNPSNGLIDMTESPGISFRKATPLDLLVAPRLLPHVYGPTH